MGGHGRALEAVVQALRELKDESDAAAVIGAVMLQLSKKYPCAGSQTFDDDSIKAVLRTAL